MRRRVRYTDLLGTVIDAETASHVGRIWRPHHVLRGEIERLTAVFDVHDESSELRRFAAGALADAGEELSAVLALAEDWHRRSNGAFDARVGRLRRVWADAEAQGREPSPDELSSAFPRADEKPSDLNAIAKGWIVDRAVERAAAVHGTSGVWLNAGGDVRHIGRRSLRVAIEPPSLNGGPVDVVALRNQALATSGGAHRGWTIAGRRFSHVIDPRSGWPTTHTGSVSVVAPDAATADVLATIATVDENCGRDLIASTRGAAALFARLDGSLHATAGWPSTRPS